MAPRKNLAPLVLALGLLATPALAEQNGHSEHHPDGIMPGQATTPGGSTMGAGSMPMMGMMRMMMGEQAMGGMRMMAAMPEHVEGRLAFLKAELKITDTQIPLWNNFAEGVRANAKAMKQTMQGGMMGTSQSASLPEKLAMREKMMTAHLDALRKFKAAVDPLYAALSDEQKKTANDLMMGPIGMIWMM
ncbi:MAG: Spy/CpxP family protein refolding chaperone [Alphaproteobacteria bacterium]|nr:Spy/CpxP family protein refolding chaperone [Alphaproteobacteria bacterium]